MNEKATDSGIGTNATKPNVNCLRGKRCPNCGSYGPFEVVVSMRVLLYDSGADDADDGSVEFDDSAPTVCYECQYRGNFGQFNDR